MSRTPDRDPLVLDEQKLFYFPQRIGQWLDAGNNWNRLKSTYPVYVEVSPAGACNHRCIFCALDFMGYRRQYLDLASYRAFIKVAARKGVRSIMFCGEGEPLLNPDLATMTRETKTQGIDVAITTNGTLLDERFCKAAMPSLGWIKVSLDAGSAATHAKIHNCSERDFDRIMENLASAVRIKQGRRLACDIGVQVLLLPENAAEVLPLARAVKKIGVDYFVVKPYTPGLRSRNIRKIDYTECRELAAKIEKLSDHTFHATFRSRAFAALGANGPSYSRCNAVPFFWAYVATNGDVYSCHNFMHRKEFCLGNIGRRPFDSIWEGPRRKSNWRKMQRMSTDACRINCRMDSVNRHLQRISHPQKNYTFI
jgi:radical SAM protein with 4Fe4S-binding SPASM domain